MPAPDAARYGLVEDHPAARGGAAVSAGWSFTPEDRKRAAEALKAKVAAGARYRRDWLDAPSWDLLPREQGIRLPAWWVAPTAAALRMWHKRLRAEAFSTVYGCSPTHLVELNPDVPLRAFVGQMLES